MKKKLLYIVFCLIGQVTFAQQKDTAQLYRKITLVELFSSEGCSSCPLADDFMQEVKAIADSNKLMVYTVDYHVDIWNRSGWVDPFSDSLYTIRQKTYCEKVGQPSMFTPMVFVNGRGAMPGTAKNAIGDLINKSVQQPSKSFLVFNVSGYADERALNVQYEVHGQRDSLELVLLLVEREVKNEVTAGENAGKTLVHHNVVRGMQIVTDPLKASSVKFPYGDDVVEIKRYMMVAMLQHKRTWEVMNTQALLFE